MKNICENCQSYHYTGILHGDCTQHDKSRVYLEGRKDPERHWDETCPLFEANLAKREGLFNEALERLDKAKGVGAAVDLKPFQESMDGMVNQYIKEGRDALAAAQPVQLKGGVALSPEGAAEALNIALLIIQSVGTTASEGQIKNAEAWIKRYYPNWS